MTTVETWRGAYLIDNRPSYGPDAVDIPSRTDKDGRLEWDSAPDDPVTFSLGKQGYANTEVTVTADGSEQTRAITPSLHISGSVVDAKTGRPIDHFQVIPIQYPTPEIPTLLRGDGWGGAREVQFLGGGRFDTQCGRPDVEHGVQIEAREVQEPSEIPTDTALATRIPSWRCALSRAIDSADALWMRPAIPRRKRGSWCRRGPREDFRSISRL